MKTAVKELRFYIENYDWGLPILDNNECYVRYFDSYELADEYLNENFYDRKDFDNFYIVKEVNGKKEHIEL